MMKTLYINNNDAFEKYGIFFSEGSISALITPPSNKEFVTANSRLEHGTRYITDEYLVRQSERSLSLSFFIVAKNRQEMYARLNSFCENVLNKGVFTLRTKYTNVTYNLIYKSCSQMQDFNGRSGKFSLQVIEPNPTNR